MATHFLDYNSVEGRWTACGRYFANGTDLPRGVAISESDFPVSCQLCLGSERLRVARARRHVSEGAVPVAENINGNY